MPRKRDKRATARLDAERLANATSDDYANAAELVDTLTGKSVTTIGLFELAAAVCRKAANGSVAS